MAIDVAIVGAGVTGLSTAFELSERRAGKVVVYERRGVNAGASGVQPGGVRQQWSTAINCRIVRKSLQFYRDVDERLQPRVSTGFRECGYLFVAHTAETLARLTRDVEVQNDVGVPSRMIRADEAAEIAGGLDPSGILGGSFCREDGYFDRPQAVVEAYAAAAIRNGVEIEIAEVAAIAPSGDGWRVSFSNGSSTLAAQVVVAAYVDTPALVSPLGIELPIRREDKYMFASDPVAERLLEPLVIAPDRRFAAKHLADGRVIASDLAASGDPDEGVERWRTTVRATIRELLPILEYVALPLLVAGVYDTTPDNQAIVGPAPGYGGLFLAAGFSGHGFMMAPAVGAGLAAAVLGERDDDLLAPLAADRFARGELVPESQVV
jgi:sarcosine oxidase, subunit beta